jgi:hypothetical protein
MYISKEAAAVVVMIVIAFGAFMFGRASTPETTPAPTITAAAPPVAVPEKKPLVVSQNVVPVPPPVFTPPPAEPPAPAAPAIPKSAPPDYSPPAGYGDSDAVISAACAKKFPGVAKLQEMCVEKQKKAVERLKTRFPQGMRFDTFSGIRNGCASASPEDYVARDACEQKAVEEHQSLPSYRLHERPRYWWTVAAVPWGLPSANLVITTMRLISSTRRGGPPCGCGLLF